MQAKELYTIANEVAKKCLKHAGSLYALRGRWLDGEYESIDEYAKAIKKFLDDDQMTVIKATKKSFGVVIQWTGIREYHFHFKLMSADKWQVAPVKPICEKSISSGHKDTSPEPVSDSRKWVRVQTKDPLMLARLIDKSNFDPKNRMAVSTTEADFVVSPRIRTIIKQNQDLIANVIYL